ncbi:MAG: hypothetical protein ABGX03_03665 [Methylophilaceae bacterium]
MPKQTNLIARKGMGLDNFNATKYEINALDISAEHLFHNQIGCIEWGNQLGSQSFQPKCFNPS